MAIKKAIYVVLFTFILASFSALAQQANSTSCGYINNNLTITANISASGDCFTINVSNTILNCDNFTVAGNGAGNAVRAENLTSITVKNCIFKKFENAISFQEINASIIENNIFNSNNRGVYLIASRDTNVTSNIAHNSSVSGYAITSGSSNNKLLSNIANTSNEGFSLSFSHNNILSLNNANKSTQYAFRLFTSNANNLTSNVGDSTQSGFYLESSNDNIIKRNSASNNSQAGFYLFLNADNNQLILNKAMNNALYGFILGASFRNSFTSNNATGSQYGFAFATNSGNNTLNSNDIYNNSIYGIYLTPGSNNNLSANTFFNNIQAAIALDGASGNNTFLNNNISGGIKDDTGNAHINYFAYSNSLGEIRWTDAADNGFLKNLSFSGNIAHGTNLFIGNNTAALNITAFGANSRINSSANITLYGLHFDAVNTIKKTGGYSTDSSFIRVNGQNCMGASCELINYANSILQFNTSSLGSFSADLEEVDIQNVSLLYTDSSLRSVLRFFMENIASSANIFNWSFQTGENTIKNTITANLTANETVFVFLENIYATPGTYTVIANGTTKQDADSEEKNVTIG